MNGTDGHKHIMQETKQIIVLDEIILY